MPDEKSRPPFVLPIADPVEEPPFYFGTKERPWISCGLYLPTDPCVLHELCQTYLNSPLDANPMVRYEALENTMWCSINRYEQAGSLPQPHEGWVEYLEITFMFGVRRITAEQPEVLCWFLPALFLDGTQKTGTRSVIYAIAGGREIFGLPKTAAAITFEQAGSVKLASALLEVVDLPLGQHDPAPLGLQQVMSAEAILPAKGPRRRRRSTRRSLVGRLLGVRPRDIHLVPDSPYSVIPALDDLHVDLTQVFGGPLVGLKQLHDATDYRTASFQAVIESSYEVREWYDRRDSLYADHLLRFRDSENVRLVESLGLEVGDQGELTVPADQSYYLKASAIYGAPAATTIWHFG